MQIQKKSRHFPLSPILIMGAVETEIQPLAAHMDNPKESRIGGRKAIFGKIGNRNVLAVVTGPGLVNAVQGLTAAIETRRPGLVIQIGCAGAFLRAGIGVGDIGIATEEIDVHLGIEPARDMEPPAHDFPGRPDISILLDSLPFPVLKKDAAQFTNRYPLRPQWVQWAYDQLVDTFEGSIRVVRGPFITVSTITATDYRADTLFGHFQPCMESMEGSGAAHVCIHYDLPFLEIRGASNLVGKRQRDLWDIPGACQKSALGAKRIIENLNLSLLESHNEKHDENHKI